MLAAGETLREGVGCRECRQTGYRGRLGVYELLDLTESLRELVMRRSSSAAIASAALAEGALATLRKDAFAKVRLGETSLTEALRVVPA